MVDFKKSVVALHCIIMQYYFVVIQSQTPQKKQLEACKSHSQHNIPNQVCSVCLCLHCFAKTTEQQGVMVIKETALQLEDAVLRPPYWQSSVPLPVSEQHSEPQPTQGEVCCLYHLGRISITVILWGNEHVL